MPRCAALFVLSLFAAPSVASAQVAPGGEEACIAAYDAAQTQRSSAQLIAARTQLEICAAASCPADIARDCTQWLGEVAAAIPSIVVVATDPSGRDTLAVKVFKDGEVLVPSVGVTAIELDPGEHRLRFEHDGAAPMERTLVLRVGQKNERIALSFTSATEPAPLPNAPLPNAPLPHPPPPHAPPLASGDGFSALFWVGVVTAGVGLTVGAISGGVAIANKSDIDERCAASCTQDDIDGAAIPAHVATGGFALLGVGAALAVIGLFLDPGGRDQAARYGSPAGLRFPF